MASQDGQRIEKDLVIAVLLCSEQPWTYQQSNDLELAHLIQDPGINLWIGPHKHAVAYTMRGGSLLNLVLEYPEPNDPSEWDKPTYIEDV
ncbi:hypothetical protein BDR22DRAFT_893109 [Usnea florida]